jgi:hypothetical protein
MDTVLLETTTLRGPLRLRSNHLWERDPLDFHLEPCWTADRLFHAGTSARRKSAGSAGMLEPLVTPLRGAAGSLGRRRWRGGQTHLKNKMANNYVSLP